MPGRQELGLLVEYLANSLLIEARGLSHVGIGAVEGFLLNVALEPSRHAVVIHHIGECWTECLTTSSANVPEADYPERYPLTMDRQVTVRHVALAEPDELTFCV